MTDPRLDDPVFLAALRRDMLRFAQLQLRNDAAAEDAVQEALAAALQNREQFASRAALRTWILSILRNKIIDHFRRGQREVLLPSDDLEEAGQHIDAHFDERGHWREETRPAEWGNPEKELETQRFWSVFEACLYRLPENTARAYLMREVVGFETPEICAALGISDKNCWVLLHRARLGLRACLGENWFA